MAESDPEMPEYDFRQGVRGKFFREGAVLLPPIHLDPEVFATLRDQAANEGVSVNELANRLLRKQLKRSDPVG